LKSAASWCCDGRLVSRFEEYLGRGTCDVRRQLVKPRTISTRRRWLGVGWE